MAEAPPDRPTLNLEQWTKQGEALLFADNQLDEQEFTVLRNFFQQVMMRAQASGGIGQGAPPNQQTGALPPSPQEMNAETSDYGSGEGQQPEEQTQGGY